MRFSRAVVYGPKTFCVTEGMFRNQVVFCERHNETKKEKILVVGHILRSKMTENHRLSTDLIKFLDNINVPSPLVHVEFDSFIKATSFVGKAVLDKINYLDYDCPYLFHESAYAMEAS